MNKSFKPSRLRWNGIALAIAGIFFVLYPALKPFSDEFRYVSMI
jgi:drug/metabolite transporter (DMT)-like permease